jgi:hypothetical protein
MDFAEASLTLCANSRPKDDWQENWNRCWEENTPIAHNPVLLAADSGDFAHPNPALLAFWMGRSWNGAMGQGPIH